MEQTTPKKERLIRVKETDYKNMKNAIIRQKRAKRILRELWNLFSQVD